MVSTVEIKIDEIDEIPPIAEAFPLGGTYDSSLSVSRSANEEADIYFLHTKRNPGLGSNFGHPHIS